jgi:N-acetylglucosamine malate deacetylase 2
MSKSGAHDDTIKGGGLAVSQESTIEPTSAILSSAPDARVRAVRESARLAALQTELRLLGSLAGKNTIDLLQPYLAVGSNRLTPTTLIRSQQDARFRVPASQLKEMMSHFGSELEKEPTAPPTLVVVAHQDDEAIGAGAQIARIDNVTVLHVTDGAPRDPKYARRFGFSSSSEYGEARRREAAKALTLAGVPADRQLCLGVSDGEASYNMVEIALALADLIEKLAPEVVLTHPYEGGHTDHDAIAFSVHLACGILRREGAATPAVMEITSYHARNGRRAVHSFLPFNDTAVPRTVRLSREASELKQKMYECFQTQQQCLSQFSVDVERFRPAPRYNFTRPPHAGELEYERLSRRMTGAEWRKHAHQALEQLRTRQRSRISLMAPLSSRTQGTGSTDFFQAGDVVGGMAGKS